MTTRELRLILWLAALVPLLSELVTVDARASDLKRWQLTPAERKASFTHPLTSAELDALVEQFFGDAGKLLPSRPREPVKQLTKEAIRARRIAVNRAKAAERR